MISERKQKRHGRRMDRLMDKYLKEKGAFIAFMSNPEGRSSLTVGGDVKILVNGIIATLIKVSVGCDNVMENVFQYVADTARAEYRRQKGLPPIEYTEQAEEAKPEEEKKETEE